MNTETDNTIDRARTHRAGTASLEPREDYAALLTQLRAGVASLEILAGALGREPPVGERAPGRRSIADERTVVHVYVAGCRGLAKLGRELRTLGPRGDHGSVYKIGVATQRRGPDATGENLDVAGRVAALGRDGYGAVALDAWGGARAMDGHRAWMVSPLRVTRAPRNRAVTVGARTLDVVLPQGSTARCFDAALREVLEPAALHFNHPEDARYTLYEHQKRNGGVRRDLARELYVGIDPVLDADRLVAMVEDAVALLEQRRSRPESRDDGRGARVATGGRPLLGADRSGGDVKRNRGRPAALAPSPEGRSGMPPRRYRAMIARKRAAARPTRRPA